MQVKLSVIAIVISVLLVQQPHAASIWESLGLKSSSKAATDIPIPEERVASGLKEALNNGIHTAVSQLGREGGFLNDPKVRIPMPENLKKVEKTLRKLRQDRLADEFVTTMNKAAEKAVPQATEVLVDSVKQMTLTDAKSILTGSDTAATEYFRRTSQTNLYQRFLPIVKTATEQAGVTSAYKNMMSKTSFGGLGNLGATLLGQESVDLDDYITRKSLDGLFAKIAEQEKLIRANPAARTTELLQQVFGSIKK
ncbi:MAG: DUF4197 domain-containing protein [Verrucomicrobia bacterium]|nr:DUF4197 domain-containing protein [Verrucomicrobiota bacterium]